MSRGNAAQRRERSIPIDPAGVVVRACKQSENRRNTGSPGGGGVCPSTSRPRGHRLGRVGVAERPVVVMKRGNSRGAKGPWFWSACGKNNGRAIGFMPSNLTNDQAFWKQLYRRAKVPTWQRVPGGESSPRAGCGKSARPVR